MTPPTHETIAETRPERAGPDLAAATRAARAFLSALGVPADALNGQDPGQRLAQCYAAVLAPVEPAEPVTPLPNDEGYHELLLARAVALRSLCWEHLVPVAGLADVGYLPGPSLLRPPALAHVVRRFAVHPRPLSQLAAQLADWVEGALRPRGVGVSVRIEHTCCSLMPDSRLADATVVVSALRGAVRDDPRARAEFFALTTSPC